MKFSCKTQDLLSGLQLVSRAIGTEQSLPILQNVLIKVAGNECVLSATNLEVSIVTRLPVAVESEGSLTVPAKAILHFVQYDQDEEILLEASEGTQLKLKSKRAKAVIAGEAASGYPVIGGIQGDTVLPLPAAPLIQALNLVTFACAKTTSRPVISGVYMRIEDGQMVLVGTDSYRLSEYKMPVEGVTAGISCIIPARFLEEVKSVVGGRKSADPVEKKEKEDGKDGKKKEQQQISIRLSPQQIEVTAGNTQLTSRLIDGKFPDYVQVLPKDKSTTVTLPTKDLLVAAKRMHYFAKEVNNNITFTASADSLHLATRLTQLGRDESTIPAVIDGIENKIAISSHYLTDFLSRIESEELKIELLDKMHPAVFRLPGNDRFLHLIMPLRMVEE